MTWHQVTAIRPTAQLLVRQFAMTELNTAAANAIAPAPRFPPKARTNPQRSPTTARAPGDRNDERAAEARAALKLALLSRRAARNPGNPPRTRPSRLCRSR